MTKYDVDFHAWAVEQAEALKRRSANEIDWDNLAEELASLGGSEIRELRSRYVVLLAHLLKWEFQPERRGRSWSTTIAIQRRDIADHISDNPSLKSHVGEQFTRAYATARLQASGETDLPLETFPVSPQFSPADACDEHWWPADASSEIGKL